MITTPMQINSAVRWQSLNHVLDVLDRERSTPPLRFAVGIGALADIPIEPGQITVIGAPPGWGKTSLGMQWAIDAAHFNPDVVVAICHVETQPTSLIESQVARLSSVPESHIHSRTLDDNECARVSSAEEKLRALAPRVSFLSPPFNVTTICNSTRSLNANFLYVDYLQEVQPSRKYDKTCDAIADVMRHLRDLALGGVAVVLTAALSRQIPPSGLKRTSESKLMQLFRDSSAIEFGAASAYVLLSDEDTGVSLLKHVKYRHGVRKDVELRFVRSVHGFYDNRPSDFDQHTSGDLDANTSGVAAPSAQANETAIEARSHDIGQASAQLVP